LTPITIHIDLYCVGLETCCWGVIIRLHYALLKLLAPWRSPQFEKLIVAYVVTIRLRVTMEITNKIAHISKEDNWPVRKSELVNKYLKQVIHFIDSIDYEKL
jgi:hypothetical protein